jgi:adenine-specific DNA-methyltransferase
MTARRGEKPAGQTSARRSAEIEALHERCGIYTKPALVGRILDAVGWRSNANLEDARLLEPAAGDGAFVVEAARRLVAAQTRRGVALTSRTLADRIKAYELHPREARRARKNVVEVLRREGVSRSAAKACARSWIVNGDFLNGRKYEDSFSHVVGNPPYVRWSKLPAGLKARYERTLSPDMVGGDLFIPVLDRSLDCLRPKGRCGFVCSDRWRFMAFAGAFRKKWLPRLHVSLEIRISASDAFVENVDSYPTVLVAVKTAARARAAVALRSTAGETLDELGCVVKVGPALGHTEAFVVNPQAVNVERELLSPWVEGSEIAEGQIVWQGRHVVTTTESDGKLIDLKIYPRLEARLKQYRAELRKRSIVVHGARWFDTIDRVQAADWARPKLLVPELAKVPRLAIDRSGLIPSHGVYAIFAATDDVEAIYERLRDGRLAKALDGIAPKVGSGYVRCYRRFLLKIRV